MREALVPIPVAPVPRLALRRVEAAESLGVSDRTLWSWTHDGIGPPTVVIGGVVLYPVAGLAEWLASRAGGGEA